MVIQILAAVAEAERERIQASSKISNGPRTYPAEGIW